MEPRTSTFFHGYAADFDAIYGTKTGVVTGLVNNMFRRSMRLRYEKTIEGCAPIEGRSVLDIGCGPGHYSVALAKAGAGRIVGVDFAQGMLDIAREHAKAEGVGDKCEFIQADFFTHPFGQPFDYVIVMGFMDYVQDAGAAVRRILELTAGRAFFSFPKSGGFLAWQRQLRYRSRCELYLYSEDSIRALFTGIAGVEVRVESIARDWFVTAAKR
jgi:2-polyprenyl-3-methyl-5-hydroxy-6-metoxy-1,4-benzoquinol methylase